MGHWGSICVHIIIESTDPSSNQMKQQKKQTTTTTRVVQQAVRGFGLCCSVPSTQVCGARERRASLGPEQ
jgi:hypothetical protein